MGACYLDGMQIGDDGRNASGRTFPPITTTCGPIAQACAEIDRRIPPVVHEAVAAREARAAARRKAAA